MNANCVTTRGSLTRMYASIFNEMKRTLGQMEKWLDAASAYADSRKFSADVFVDLRLAPDQFPFVRQVQIACDTAKLAASRVSGKEAPSHADNEKTLAELRTRLQSVIAYLGTFSEKDFVDAANRKVTQPRWEGKWMTGHDYFVEHALPNFFFHASHAYAILRHNGVPIGKRDYLGTLTQHAP